MKPGAAKRYAIKRAGVAGLRRIAFEASRPSRSSVGVPSSGRKVKPEMWDRFNRHLGGLRGIGVIDGLWTFGASVGSKVQMLALLGAAGASGGISNVGHVVLAVSLGTVVYAIGDAGLTMQTVRTFAAEGLRDRSLVLRPLGYRALVDLPIGFCLGYFSFGSSVAWGGVVVAFALSLHVSTVVTQMAFGMFRFRSGSLANGIPRLAAAGGLAALGSVGTGPMRLVLVCAVTELVVGGLQFWLIGAADHSPNTSPSVFSIRTTWRLGLASVANVVVNKSDAVLVASVSSAAVVGTYGIASQIENALIAAALIPAGGLIAHSARASRRNSPNAIRKKITVVVLATYVALALPTAIFAGDLVRVVLGVEGVDLTAIRVCILAGLFSSLGAVALQQLVGLGSQSSVMLVWVLASIVTVVAMLVGASLAGALGASFGALARDVCIAATAQVLLARRLVCGDGLLKARRGLNITS